MHDSAMDPLLKHLRDLRLVHRGDVELANAGKSDFYIDVKKAFGPAHIHGHICEELHKRIPRDVNVVAGSGHGGEPPATGLQ